MHFNLNHPPTINKPKKYKKWLKYKSSIRTNVSSKTRRYLSDPVKIYYDLNYQKRINDKIPDIKIYAEWNIKV